MTLFNQGKSARTVSKGVICDTEDQVETLYTCPANCRAEVSMLYVVNAMSSGTTTAEVKWFKSATSEEFRLIGGKNLAASGTVLLTQATLVLEPSDQLRAIASDQASPDIDAMCTVTEIFIPIG